MQHLWGPHGHTTKHLSFLLLLIWFSKSWTRIEASPTMLEYYHIAISGNKNLCAGCFLDVFTLKRKGIGYRMELLIHRSYTILSSKTAIFINANWWVEKEKGCPFSCFIMQSQQRQQSLGQIDNQRTGMIYFVHL